MMEFDKRFNPKELRDFLQKTYGPGVQVEVFPQAQQEVADEGADPEEKRKKDLEFAYKPREIKEHLDRFVIRQDDAKKVLATAICDHYHHAQMDRTSSDRWSDYKKQNILLIGPTGVGKTYLIQNIARLIGVPFVKADATKYSETGYVGGDVEDLIRELVSQADGDVALAEYGIVYLDEIDKLASPAQVVGRDVSGHGVQRNLLKLMEETEVPLRSPTDIASQMQAFMEFQSKGKVEKKTINTRHILFIVSGAFNGLTEIIKKRIGSKQIGFTGDKTTADQEGFLLDQVKSVDFLEYGFEAEFTGRLPVVVHCSQLSADDMFDILKHSEGSILKQYKRDFLSYGIDVYFTDGGMRRIAELSVEERTGARGLMSVCEKLFREFKYRLPDSEVREFVVTEDLVGEPEKELMQLLEEPARFRAQVQRSRLKKLEDRILEKYGVSIALTEEGYGLLATEAQKTGKDPLEFSEAWFGEFEHALRLLAKNSGDKQFKLSAEALQSLPDTLERWIQDSYGR